MKYFAAFFAAIMAVSLATPVEVEERQMNIINMIINMLKGFVCNMQAEQVQTAGGFKPPNMDKRRFRKGRDEAIAVFRCDSEELTHDARSAA